MFIKMYVHIDVDMNVNTIGHMNVPKNVHTNVHIDVDMNLCISCICIITSLR